jgi:hypothetical protein
MCKRLAAPSTSGLTTNARSQARKQITKIPLKAPTTARDRSRISRMKTADPVAKKIVAKRRRL